MVTRLLRKVDLFLSRLDSIGKATVEVAVKVVQLIVSLERVPEASA